jgi:hypothetical protein
LPSYRVIVIAAALATACSPAPPAPAKPAASVAPAKPAADVAPPPLPAPLEVGSQAARDAYYCAGILDAAYPRPDVALSPTEMAPIFRAEADAIALRMDGFFRLMDEKAALPPQAGAVADAWTDVAAKELAQKKPRIALKDCETLARKLPPPAN